MARNRQILLRRPVADRPVAGDFELVEAPMPEPAVGEILIRHRYLSLDPYMGSAIKGRHMSGAIRPGMLMPAETIGEVVASRNADFAEGMLVVSRGGWQDFSLAASPSPGEGGMAAALSAAARRLDPMAGVPVSAYLGALGMPGLTAYAGVVELLQPRPGETFVVSAASGAVGSAAGQVARHMGARVVGIAGSEEKCRAVTGTFGFDACIDRHAPDWRAELKMACPDGVDAYFDTVGGDMLAGVMGCLAMNARILLCGMMDQYNSADILPGPSLAPVLARRASIRGLVVYDHWHRLDRWRSLAGGWIAAGRFAFREQRAQGLEVAPSAFEAMMAGRNFGKTIVALDP